MALGGLRYGGGEMMQLLLHLIGDYVTQSHWMAANKRKSWWAASVHASVYALPFLWLTRAAPYPHLAYFVICSSHLLIDRFGLARYVVFAKNFLSPRPWPLWEDCKATGYPDDVPVWLSFWLSVAADNTIHLAINYCALRWL